MVDAFVYAALRVISLASERKKKKKKNETEKEKCYFLLSTSALERISA